MPAHEFRVIHGCPVPKLIAPYVDIVVSEARATLNSAYRGADAEWLLHKYGKHSQAELYDGFVHGRPGFLPANPPGFSTHELKSDGSGEIARIFRVRRGGDLPWWGLGFDVNDWETDRCIAVAAKHGWRLERPYPSGSEHHHLNFVAAPAPQSVAMRARVAWLRATLPRS